MKSKLKKARHIAWFFTKMGLIGGGEASVIVIPIMNKFCKTNKQKLLVLAISEVALIPINWMISTYETINLANRLEEVDEEEN